MSNYKKQFGLILFLAIGLISTTIHSDDTKKEKSSVQKNIIYTVPKDEKLNYYQYNYESINKKRLRQYNQSKYKIPELLWVKKWKFLTTKPYLDGDRVLVSMSSGDIRYFEPRTGAAKGSVTVKTKSYWLHSIDFERLISFGSDGQLYSVLLSNMKKAFKVKAFDAKEQLFAGITPWGAGVYVSRLNHLPIFINCNKKRVTGKPSAKLDAELTVPLVISGSDMLLCTADGKISAYDRGFTRVRYSYQLPESYATSMISDGPFVYVSSADHKFRKINLKKNKIIWEKETTGTSFNSIVKKDDDVYLTAGSFYIFNAKKGKELLNRSTVGLEGFGRTKPVVTKDRIFVCDRVGNFYIFNKETKELLQAINLNADVMVDFIVTEGTLIIGTTKGHLLGIDLILY